MNDPAVYEFGGYRFEPAVDRLLCGDQVIRLTPKATETLLVLARRAGTVVSKEELFDAVWPGVAVEENNLNQQISALRKALSRHGSTVTIETVPRRGYRLVGAVNVVAPPAPAESTRTESTPADVAAAMPVVELGQDHPRTKVSWRWATALLAVVALSGALWSAWRGYGHWDQQRQSARALEQGNQLLGEGNAAGAVTALQNAIRLNAANAQAYGALAQALSRAYAAPSSAVRPVGASPSVAAAEKSVALDPLCAECRGTLGFFLFYHDWKWQEAEAHLREAIRLDPDREGIRPSYAMLLAATGRQPEALQQVDLALAKRPYQITWTTIRASILYFDRRYAEAIAATDQALRLQPNERGAWEWRSKALFQLNRGPEAIQALAQELFAEHSAELDRAVQAGSTAGGLRRLLELTDDWRGRVEQSWRRAQWRMLLADHDGALDELERATEMRRLNAIYFGVDPVYDSIRHHPRYRAILTKIGLDQRETQ